MEVGLEGTDMTTFLIMPKKLYGWSGAAALYSCLSFGSGWRGAFLALFNLQPDNPQSASTPFVWANIIFFHSQHHRTPPLKFLLSLIN